MAMLEDSIVLGYDDVNVPDGIVRKNLAKDLIVEEEAAIAVCKEHMRVYLRVRPFTDDEVKHGENKGCVEMSDDHSVVVHAPKDSNTFKNSAHHTQQQRQHQKFTFSQIFNEKATQKEVFDEAVYGTVKQFIDGQNCLIFAYGVTNSGKTYTIRGSPHDLGMLPRSLDVLFNSIQGRQWRDMSYKPNMFCDVVRLTPDKEAFEAKLKEAILKRAENDNADTTSLGDSSDSSQLTIDSMMSEDSLMRQSLASNISYQSNGDVADASTMDIKDHDSLLDTTSVSVESQGNIRFSVWVSFTEIYNECIYDLLETPKTRGAKRPTLPLKEDRNGIPYVRGLKEIQVTSAEEAFKILTVGQRNLQIAGTRLNHNSSRSHCIFTVKMLRMVDTDKPHMARISMLSFCDLAGSERYTKTQSFGDRIKEAGNINTSLLTLGRCIQMLRQNQIDREHQQIVPFRDSKLTRLFQSFFCGKGRASMIVNVNQCASTFDETLHALKYSAIARQVVVVQEPEKPKTRGPSKLSMMLTNPSLEARHTIGWASPATCARVMEEEEADGTATQSDFEDDEMMASEREKELLEVVEQLKQQVVQAHRQRLMMETSIREEICEEMAQQLVAIETNYSERLMKEQALLEEKHEKRLELLSQSVLKARKRKRIQDEEEESASSVLLYQEQAKLTEREHEVAGLKERVSDLEDELETLKAATRASTEGRDKLQYENTSLTFQVNELERKVEKAAAMAESVADLQSMVEESKAAMSNTEEVLREKEQAIVALQKELEQARDMSMDQSRISEMGDLISKLADAEAELDQCREQETKLQQMIDMLQCDADDKLQQVRGENAEQLERLKQLKAELEEKDAKLEQIAREKDAELEQMAREKDAELEQIAREKDAELEQMAREKDAELEQMAREKDAKLEQIAREKDAELEQIAREKDSELEHMAREKDVATATQGEKEDTAAAELEALRRDVESLRQDLSARQEEVDKLSADVSERDDKLQRLTVLASATDDEVGKLEGMAAKAAEHARALGEEVKEKEELITKLRMDLENSHAASADSQRDSSQETRSVVKELEERISMEKSRLKAAKEEHGASLNQLSRVKAENAQLQQAHAEMKNEAEDSMFVIDELREKVSELEEKLRSLTSEGAERTGEHRKALEEMEARCLKQEEELSAARDFRATLEAEVAQLKEGLLEAKTTLENASHEHDGMVAALKAKQNVLEAALRQAESTHQGERQRAEKLETDVKQRQAATGGLEESLQLANEALRAKAIELSDAQSTVDKSAAELSSKEEKLQAAGIELVDAQKQLDDYIVQVNEQAEIIGELKDELKALKGEEKEVKDDVSLLRKEKKEVEKALAGKEKTLAQLEARVKQMEEATTRERKTHRDAKEEMQGVIEAKSTRVEQLTSELRDLSKDIIAEKDKAAVCLKEYEQVKKRLAEAEESRRAENDSGSLQVSELTARVEELEAAVEELRREKLEAQKAMETAERKLAGAVMNAELQEEDSTREMEETLESTRAELKEKTARLLELENQIRAVKKEDEDEQPKVPSEMEEEISRLKAQVGEYRQQLDDAEYKHQMSCRQMRREKAQLEKVMKEYEESNEEYKAKLAELPEKRGESENVGAATERVTQLEDVVRELENCLKSSKDSEQRAIDQGDTYRDKCRQLEKDLGCKEEHIQTLKEELEGQGREESHRDLVLQDKIAKIADLEEELKKCQKNISDLEFDLNDAGEETHRLEREVEDKAEVYEVRVKELTQELEEVLQKLKAKTEEFSELEKRHLALQDGRDNHSGLEREAAELREQIKKLQSGMEENSDCLKHKADEIEVLKKQVHDITEHTTESFKDKIHTIQEEKRVAEEKYRACESDNLEYKSRAEQLQTESAELKTRLADMEAHVRRSEERLLEAERQAESTLDSKLRAMQEHLVTMQQNEETAAKEIKQLQEQQQTTLADMRERECKMEAEINTLQRKVKDNDETQKQTFEAQHEGQLRELQSELELARHAQASLRDELTSLQSLSKANEKQISLLQEQVDRSKERESSLRAELQEATRCIETRNAELTSVEDQRKEARDALETETAAGVEARAARTQLQLEVDTLTSDLKNKSERLSDLKQEIETLQSMADRREAKLNSRNETLQQLMNKMEQERNGFELALKDARCNEMMIETLKGTVEEMESVMKTQDDVLNRKESDIKEINEELNETIEKYTKTLNKVQEQSTVIRELRSEQEDMKNKLHVAERQVGLHKQDLQSMVDTVAQLRGGSQNHEIAKKEIEILHREKRSAEERLDDARAMLQREKDAAEQRAQEVARVRAELERLQGDRGQAEKDLDVAQKDVSRLDQAVKDKSVEVEMVKAELESTLQEMKKLKSELLHRPAESDQQYQKDGTLKILKTKFQTLEDRNRQLEQEKIQWQERATATEQEKGQWQSRATTMEQQKQQELAKWRDERDKLVGQIERILKEKDAQISLLKDNPKTSSDGDEVTELRRQLQEKDDLIKQLSEHLDDRTARRATRGRHRSGTNSSSSNDDQAHIKDEADTLQKQGTRRANTGPHRVATNSSSSNDDSDNIKKELDLLQKQLLEERIEHRTRVSNLVKAKDEIINDMRLQNQQLVKRISYEEETPVRAPCVENEEEAQPKPKSRRATRAKSGKKNKHRDADQEETQPEVGATKRTRRSTRSRPSNTRTLNLDENEDPTMSIIAEEEVIDLDEYTPKKHLPSHVLNNSTNAQDDASVFVSPKPPPKAAPKRKRRLLESESAMFSASPLDPDADLQIIPDSPHEIVKRRLRTRKR